jgi:hypothetical protein
LALRAERKVALPLIRLGLSSSLQTHAEPPRSAGTRRLEPPGNGELCRRPSINSASSSRLASRGAPSQVSFPRPPAASADRDADDPGGHHLAPLARAAARFSLYPRRPPGNLTSPLVSSTPNLSSPDFSPSNRPDLGSPLIRCGVVVAETGARRVEQREDFEQQRRHGQVQVQVLPLLVPKLSPLFLSLCMGGWC